MADLQDELKRRETRWNGSAARFRKKVEDLDNENYELKETLKLLEKERLQRWSKADKQSNVRSKLFLSFFSSTELNLKLTF